MIYLADSINGEADGVKRLSIFPYPKWIIYLSVKNYELGKVEGEHE